MFKIESYVTPLILSYVNKYIKNIKPEDSQVSSPEFSDSIPQKSLFIISVSRFHYGVVTQFSTIWICDSMYWKQNCTPLSLSPVATFMN